MSNSSATGGYLLPTTSLGPPGGLTLKQFLQTVFVGISGYPDTLVRPRWQLEPPPQPDVTVDWIAFGIVSQLPDTYANLDSDTHGNYYLNRYRTLELLTSFYGPNAEANIAAFQDGFQVTQNLEALASALMGYKECSPALHAPELVNERWMDRYDTTISLVMQAQRTYNVLSFASATITINTVFTNPYSKTITVEGP